MAGSGSTKDFKMSSPDRMRNENGRLLKTYPLRQRPSNSSEDDDMVSSKFFSNKKRLKDRFCYCIIFSLTFMFGYSIYVDKRSATVTTIPTIADNERLTIPPSTFFAQSVPTKNITKSFKQYSYVKSAFRVSNTEIRLSIIRDVKNSDALYYRYGRKRGKLKLVCQQKQCIDPYSPPCVLNGFIGIVDGLIGNDSNPKILLSKKEDDASNWEEIPIRDVRISDPVNHAYQHKLGVCLQPVYLHSDYSLFIDFFEYWLSEGATKFYIYRESYSSEVAQILQFYQSTSKANIEIIDWSYLPSLPKSSENNNPNAYVYRLEVMLAIMDCVYRARGETKFVAQTDLDEMLYIRTGQKLIPFLEMVNSRYKDMASASFRSQRVKFNNTWDEVTSPLEINFDKFKSVEVEDFIFQRPLYTKMVYRPERVKHLHIHQQYKTELNPDNKRLFKHVNLATKDALVLHMRRLNGTFNWHNTTRSTLLASYVPIWNKSYKERLQNYHIGNYTWRNVGIQVNEEVEDCRNEVVKTRMKKCHNLFVCEKKISAIKPNEWVRAKNSWVVI